MKNDPAVINPVAELLGHLARFSDRCRASRWFGALFHVGVAQDIVADIAKQQDQIRDAAHAAETYDLEALAKIDEATSPESDGGVAITPKELRAIKPLIVKSATLDHDTADLANIQRA